MAYAVLISMAYFIAKIIWDANGIDQSFRGYFVYTLYSPVQSNEPPLNAQKNAFFELNFEFTNAASLLRNSKTMRFFVYNKDTAV